MMPVKVLRRLYASIAEWPTGRTDGTLAVLWSLAAWVFVLAAVVLVGMLVATSQHLVDADLVQDLVEDDKSVIVLALVGLFMASWLLGQHRLLTWRTQRVRREREPERPPSHILVQPDPDVMSSDRVMGALWLYLVLLLLVPVLGG